MIGIVTVDRNRRRVETRSSILIWAHPTLAATTTTTMTDVQDLARQIGPTEERKIIMITAKKIHWVTSTISRTRITGDKNGKPPPKQSLNRRSRTRPEVRTRSSKNTKRSGKTINSIKIAKCRRRPAEPSSKGRTRTSSVKAATTPTGSRRRATMRRRTTRGTWMRRRETIPGRGQARKGSTRLAATLTMMAMPSRSRRNRRSKRTSLIWETKRRRSRPQPADSISISAWRQRHRTLSQFKVRMPAPSISTCPLQRHHNKTTTF